MIWSSRFYRGISSISFVILHRLEYLESFVLQDSFNGSIAGQLIIVGKQPRLEDDSKGSIADDFALGIFDVLGLASSPILHLLTNHVCSCALVANSSLNANALNLPPMRKEFIGPGRLSDMLVLAAVDLDPA